MKIKTTEQFIIDAKKVHGDKYDYSLVEYEGNMTKVKIICKIHNTFEQKPLIHISGFGCQKCSNKYMDTEYFKEKASKVHGDRYDYSLVNYKNARTEIDIICKTHGLFKQLPSQHLFGKNCQKCSGKYMDTEYFKEKAMKMHGETYDYSLVEYVGTHKKVKIICKKHGVFEQTPNRHLSGQKCPFCFRNFNKTTSQFIKDCVNIHGDTYIYDLVEYKNSSKKVKIICKEHGVFEQKANSHLSGHGCLKCGGGDLDDETFKKRAMKIHGTLYDYSMSNYMGAEIKIKIICKEHGIFKQTPHVHLAGSGCKKCVDSNGERKIKEILKQHNILYDVEKTFNGCKYKYLLKFDFYLPDYNVCIEFDGRQHFESVIWFGGDSGLEKTKIRDQIKNDFCKNNNITLYRIRYDENINECMNDILKIINKL